MHIRILLWIPTMVLPYKHIHKNVTSPFIMHDGMNSMHQLLTFPDSTLVFSTFILRVSTPQTSANGDGVPDLPSGSR